MLHRLRHDQRGFVSLLTVSLMSVLILLLTIGMVRLVNGELHQATDSADSIKAYYTAQGAAENAAQQLRDYVETGNPVGRTANDLTSLNQGCGSSSLYPAPATAVTSLNCIKVTTSTTQVDTDLGENQTQTYDLSSSVLTEGGSLTRLVVSWDDTNVSGGGSFTDPGDGSASWNTTGSTTGNQPPVMELGITNYFPNQNTNVNQTYSGTVFLDPRPTSAGGIATSGAANSFDYVCYLPNTVGNSDPALTEAATPPCATTNTPVMQVNCTNSVLPKRCTATITEVVPQAGDRTVLTITPLFHDAQFTLSAYATPPLVGSSATCLADATTTANHDCLAPIALQDAEVDVTATVSGTTRRIVMSVPVRTVQALNDVLEGDSDICKSFDILNVGGTYQVAQGNGSGKPSCIINDNLGAYDPEPSGPPPPPPPPPGPFTANVNGSTANFKVAPGGGSFDVSVINVTSGDTCQLTIGYTKAGKTNPGTVACPGAGGQLYSYPANVTKIQVQATETSSGGSPQTSNTVTGQ